MDAYILTFVSVFLVNVLYTYFLKAVNQNKILTASVWATTINFIASIAVIEYINNHWLLIPSCLGSFLGTIAGMKIKNNYYF